MASIVMRSAVRSKLTPREIGAWEWWIINNPLTPEGRKLVKRDRAISYIKDNGLVLALNTLDGAIYDTPGRDFQRAWKGRTLDTIAKRTAFDKIWNK